MSLSILVTGSRGVIGTQLCKILMKHGHNVIGTCRPSQTRLIESEIVIEPWKPLSLGEFDIDLVVHLAGIYVTKYEIAAIERCFNTNVGLAATIANFQKATKTPVIAIGSFFEKAPTNLQPWTYYASSKIASFNVLKEAADFSKSKLIYLYLYDTYGNDTSRGKFIDLIVEAVCNAANLDASGGKQVQDLTHIDDVSNAIMQVISDINTFDEKLHEFQIRSKEVVSLQDLAKLANSSTRSPIEVNWGKFPYREREVFELWESALDLPNWKPRHNLTDYFRDRFQAVTKGN